MILNTEEGFFMADSLTCVGRGTGVRNDINDPSAPTPVSHHALFQSHTHGTPKWTTAIVNDISYTCCWPVAQNIQPEKSVYLVVPIPHTFLYRVYFIRTVILVFVVRIQKNYTPKIHTLPYGTNRKWYNMYAVKLQIKSNCHFRKRLTIQLHNSKAKCCPIDLIVICFQRFFLIHPIHN